MSKQSRWAEPGQLPVINSHMSLKCQGWFNHCSGTTLLPAFLIKKVENNWSPLGHFQIKSSTPTGNKSCDHKMATSPKEPKRWRDGNAVWPPGGANLPSHGVTGQVKDWRRGLVGDVTGSHSELMSLRFPPQCIVQHVCVQHVFYVQVFYFVVIEKKHFLTFTSN